MPNTRLTRRLRSLAPPAGRPVLLGLALLLGAGVAARAAAPTPPLTLEMSARCWRACELDPGTTGLKLLPAAVQLSGKLPGSFGAAYRCWENWEGYRRLSVRLQVPAGFPAWTELQLYLKDNHYYWYQAFPLRDAKGKRLPLKAGEWLTLSVPIQPFSRAWEPGGHKQVWYDALYCPREFGLRFFSDKAWTGTVQIASVTLDDYVAPLGREPLRPAPKPSPLLVTLSAKAVPVYEKLEFTTPLDAYYQNPWDPLVVSVEGHFLSPSGKAVTVPGFYYSGFERTRTDQGFEKLLPVGAPQWKVRFSPREAGTWRWYLSLRDARGERRSSETTFAATAPLHPQGLAQVSKRDPHYFEFEDGSNLYPLGINMRDGGDQAEAQEGTYAFDHFLPLFKQHGLSLVRTWMCAWWAGIEWSPRYHSRYAGLGRFSQYNAWRLDYLFDLAAAQDMYLELTLGSHGQLRQDKFDAEWKYNPFAVENGGYLPAPFLFFSSRRAQSDMQNRYRYIAARWGYSRNLFAYDLWNEIELSEAYSPAESAEWHQEMARYLRAQDPNPHLIVSHIALYWSYGEELWNLPEIQYIQSDSYWKRRDVGMNESFAKRTQYQKPFIFIEYGPQTSSLPQPEAVWLQEFRSGLWTSALMPWSAPGVFWYPQEWEQYKMWEFLPGLQKFTAGEDRRGKHLRLTMVRLQPDAGLTAQAMQNDTQADFYVFNYDALGQRQRPAPLAAQGPTATVTGLKPGPYRAEFWDTLTGAIAGSADLTSADGSLAVPLPPIPQDLAVKIRPR